MDPALFLGMPELINARYKKRDKMAYSTTCAVFLIIKSHQIISVAIPVGKLEKAKMTPSQKITGSQKQIKKRISFFCIFFIIASGSHNLSALVAL